MSNNNIWVVMAVVALVVIVGLAAYLFSLSDGGNAFTEAQVLERLEAEWPELEQGPLKHAAESGHWFLNEVQFIASSTVIVWYEDGLNDEFAVLGYLPATGTFDVRMTFQDRSELEGVRATYGTSGYPLSIYTYDGATGNFTRTTQSTVFDGSNSAPTSTTDGTVSRVKIALLNPDGTLPNEAKEGDLSGCDHVVLKEREIEPTRAPLAAALNLLLAEAGGWSEGGKVYNYIGQGELKLDAVAITDGTARIHLTGTPPPLGGVCDDPRILVQVTQTARQFPSVQQVELYINGVRNTGASNLQG